MNEHLIPLMTTEVFRKLPDQATELINRLVYEANENKLSMAELTNEIIVLKQQVADLEKAQPIPPSPTPTGEWQQILQFYPEDMGHEAGMCLKNCRLGYHIPNGTSTSAYNDMLYNRSQGTLHEETPPVDIAVPVYCGSGTVNGHVVVWDHGVVWSDGEIVPEGLSHWNVVYGWGELCDHVRVVMPV